MEDVHAKDDLFQGACRDGTHEEGLAILDPLTMDFQMSVATNPSGKTGDGEKTWDLPLPVQGIFEGPHVPTPL
jgi:hypothetical protein